MAVSNKKKKQYTNDFAEWQNQNSGQLLASLLAAAGKQAEKETQKIPYADITPKLTKAEPTTSNSGGSALPSFSAMDMAKGLNHAVLGGMNQAEYGAKSGVSLAQQLVNAALGNEANVNMYANRQKRLAQEYLQQQQKLDDKYGAPTTGIGKFADQALSGAVGMAPLLPLYAVPGVGQALGTGAIFLSGGGMGQGNALMEGASVDDSLKYGAVSGAIEAGTERLFGGLPLQKGLINAGGKVAAKVGKESLKPVIEKGVDLLGEGVEEGIVEALDPFAQRATYNPDAENASAKDIAYAAALGTATAAIMNGAAQVPKQLPKAVKNLPNAEKVQQNDQNRAFEALHGQKMGQNQIVNAQNAQNRPEKAQANGTTNPIQTPNKVAQNQSSQADFTHNAVKNVQNRNTNDITPKLEDARPKITLEISERTFENVGAKNVKAYQQENPSVKPFQQEVAANLLSDLQMGQKGGREVGFDPMTRNVTVVNKIDRMQSEPINRMLDDGMEYSEIEDGLQRIVEDHGKENTANAKRAELYVHDAVKNGYNSVTGERVNPNRAFAYRGKSQAELLEIMEQLENSFTGNAEQDAAIISEMETVHSILEGMKNDITPKLERAAQPEPTVAENTTVEESSTVDRMAEYEDIDLSTIPADIFDFWNKATDKSGVNIRIVKGLPDNVNGMYRDGMIYLNANKLTEPETVRMVTAHEVYHAMKNTDEFRNLQDVALDFYRTINPKLTNVDLAQMKIEEYAAQGVQLTEEEAYEELAADFMEVALFDAKVAERIWTEHPTLAQRIKWFIDDLLFEFRNRKLSDLEYKQAALLYNAQQMYAEGLQSMKYRGQDSGDTRYMFAGELSRTADLEALARARQMEASGADMESIRQETGWFKSKVTGGEWAYEISDKGIEFSRNAPRFPVDFEAQKIRKQMVKALTEEQDFEKYKQLQKQLNELPTDTTPRRDILMDWMSHPELYEAYPHLRNMPFKLDETINANGEFDGNTIRVNSSLDKMYTKDGIPIHMAIDDTTQTMLHEVQHAVQRIEGFPRGSSPAYWEGNKIPTKESLQKITEAEKKIADVEAKFRKEWPNDEINLNLVKRYDVLDKLYFSGKPVDEDRLLAEMAQIEEAAEMAGFDDLLTEYLEAQAELSLAEKYPDYIMPFDAYQNTAGEIMARDTTNRRFMDSEQRKQKQPVMGDENTLYADGGRSYYIETDPDGTPVVVIENPDANPSKSESEKYMHDIFRKLTGTGRTEVYPEDGGSPVIINKRSIGEYLRSGYVEHELTDDMQNVVYVSGKQLDELLKYSREVFSYPNADEKHKVDANRGWSHREVVFEAPDYSKEDSPWRRYTAKLIVRKNDTGDYSHGIIGLTKKGSATYGTAKNSLHRKNAEPFDGDILPQNQRKVNDGVRYSLPSDQEYLDAVNHGDMETAQRMVDEAAKAAGYSERLYHQTGAVFSEFDTENQKAGKYDYIMPTGIFLKPDDGDIGLRGKLQMELYAKIQKPLEFRDRIEMQNYWFKRLPNYENLSRQVDENDVEYKKRIDIAMDRIRQARQDFFDGKITEEDRSRIREESKAETDRLFAEWSEANNELALQMKGMIDEYMKSSDYDGVIVENDEGSFGRSTKAYIVFDSSQLKSADAKTYDNEGNIVPLSQRFDAGNADIRYSMSKDTSGRQLTAEQAEYFKNSKVRDDNGNLKVVYHGSPSKFYEFDWAKVGTNGTQEGKGFYFADNEDIAWEYVNSTDGGARAFYLNIKNPLSGLEVTLSKAKVKRLLKESDKFVQQVFDDDYFLDNWGDTAYYGKDKVLNEAVDGLFKYNQSDADILYDIMNTAGIYNNADVQSYMEFITDKFGYDGIITEWLNWETGGGDTIYVAFNSNSAKLTSNQNPTDSKDIRYSVGNSRYQEMLDRYGSIEPGENPTGNNRDVKVPKQTSDFDKTRKFTRTAMEAEQVDDVTTGMIADDLTADMQSGRFIYEPTSNQKQVDRANSLINQTGWEEQAANFRAKYRSGESMSADDIALGERLIQEAQKAGDYQMAVDLIADVAAIGTEAGRSVQALKILKRLTPEGQLMALKRIEQRINSSLAAQQKPPVALPESIAEEMLQARGSEKQAEIWDKAIKELANQVPATFADKVNAWRYLAMLSNPKTHFRNIVGNATMRAVMGVKNVVQTGIETTLSPFGIERAAAIKVPKEYRDFAKWDFENNAKKMLEAGGGRYNDEIGLVSQNKQIFKNPVLETARKKNTELLEAEDMLFKKAAYIDAMARYMKANGLSPSVLQNQSAGNNATYEKAQNYAVEQARKATFQEASKLAQKLSEIENMSTTGKVVVGALVPFKKTPINILKRGVEYSPVGIINGVKKAMFDVKKGEATPAEVIEAMSAGLTGTGIMMVGYFLASMGLLSAGADDDDQRKARYDSQMGNQNYALVLPDGSTYTIDWLAPSVMPMMVGAELYKQLSGEQADSNNATGFTKAMEALTRVGNPLLEMSMLQGLTDALQSYNSGTGQFLSDFAISAGTGYAGQFIPAPVSAMARTLDDTVRSSYAPKDSPLMKEGESFLRQQANKLPVVSQQMQPSIDLWGNERKREGDTIAERAFHNFINPGTYSSNKRTALDNKLDKLYEATGDSNVLPKSADSYIKVGDNTIYMTALEYAQFSTTKGQKSKEYVTDFINSSAYRTLDDTTKAGIVADLYNLANYQAKKQILSGRRMSDLNENYEKVLKSGVAPGKYYAAKEALSNFTGDGSKDKKIAYLQNMKNSGEITDRQFWYMRRACIGVFNKAEMAACQYADIKNM